MIVLDEQIYSVAIAREIAKWYPGKVVSVRELRPHTLVQDDGIDVLLQGVSSPTFATINISDFWYKIAPGANYCVVCMELSQLRARETPRLLRRFLNLPQFNTKAKRMGVVALLRPTRIEFYRLNQTVQALEW